MSVHLSPFSLHFVAIAEKNLWMQLLSETCDYCETEDFLEYEASRAAEDALQQQQQLR